MLHPLHRPAPIAGRARLRRRNRRTLPPARWHPCASIALPLEQHAQRRPAPVTSAQKRKNPDAPHLQPLRPPRFGRRYLNETIRGDIVSLQLIRHFLVATQRISEDL